MASQNTMPAEPGPPVSASPSPWALLGLVLATFVALCAATFALPHDKYVRYQQLAPTMHFRTVWSFERLHYDKTPIDVAIIGNSRLKSAVGAPDLAAALSARLGRPVNVVNIAMAQEGRNVHAVLAQELFATHPEVKLVILSAIEQMPRDGHPAFRNIADAGDVLAAPLAINRGYLDDLAYQPFRQMSLFVQTQLPGLFSVHRTFDAARYDGSNFDTRVDGTGMTGADGAAVAGAQDVDQLRAEARARVRGISPPVLPAAAADMEFAVERHYTRQIADMARAHGARIAFLYTPIFENPEPLREAVFYNAIGPVISATGLAADPANFTDYGHLNHAGSAKVTALVAEQVAASGLLDNPAQEGE